MNTTDPRAHDLLSRVSEDISLLRHDIGNLFSHATKHTIPQGARGLASGARTRLMAGRTYSAEQIRALRAQVNQPAAAWVGGALVIGLLAAGVYLFCKSDCCIGSCEEPDDDI